MAVGNYRVTLGEQDYNYTTYTVWVSANSRVQAIAKAAALAGQEKARRELELHPARGVSVEGLMEPTVAMEKVGADEYWDKRDTVEVATI